MIRHGCAQLSDSYTRRDRVAAVQQEGGFAEQDSALIGPVVLAIAPLTFRIYWNASRI
jgi:hypothetical protein